MRIVSAAEAVAGVRPATGLPPLRGRHAVRAARCAGRAAPELHDVGVVHLHIEGPGPHLAPEMAGHFRHRALFIGPNARAAVNEGRADYVPVFLSDVPRLFDPARCRSTPSSSTRRRPTRHGFCSLGTSRRGDARGDPRREDGHRPAQPVDAADAGRQLHPRRRHRPRGRGGPVPPYEHATGADRRRRAADRRARRGARPRRRDAPAGDRRHPGGDGAGPRRTSATSASTPRCSPTRSSTSSRPASSPGAARSATAARS